LKKEQTGNGALAFPSTTTLDPIDPLSQDTVPLRKRTRGLATGKARL